MEYDPSLPEEEPRPFDLRPLEESRRSNMEEWADAIHNDESDRLRTPPVSMIMYRDLLERAWGWDRLLPKVHGSIDWDEFKKYLQEYMQFNASEVAHGKDALHAAANKFIETENKLIRSCLDRLTHEALSVSTQIKKRAKDLIQSDVEYPVAASALLCITTEAELMYEFVSSGFQVTKTLAFSTEVRQSASNMMFYKGPESAAAAGAMVGMATEARMILKSTHHGIPDVCVDYFTRQSIRKSIGVALTKLEQELACKTTDNAGALTDSTKKPMGFSGDLKCEESCSMGKSKREMDEYCEKGEKKSDTTDEVQESTKEVKDAGEDDNQMTSDPTVLQGFKLRTVEPRYILICCCCLSRVSPWIITRCAAEPKETLEMGKDTVKHSADKVKSQEEGLALRLAIGAAL